MKKNVAVMFGSGSPESEISIISAKNVFNAIDKNLFNVFIIYMTLDNEFLLLDNNAWQYLDKNDQKRINYLQSSKKIFWTKQGIFYDSHFEKIDSVFPVMHGKLGEDGHLQGFLTLLSIPYVGCDLRSSVLGMNKDLFKNIMINNDIPVLPFLVIDKDIIDFKYACQKLSSDILFVKPCAGGSSIANNIVANSQDWHRAIAEAKVIDSKVLVEPYLENVREVECAVWLDHSVASTLGEIVTTEGFYDYENKYSENSISSLSIPANLPEELSNKIRDMAYKVAIFLDAKQYSRVDFFIHNNSIYVNEVNTLPGFTPISMFPLLLEYDGFSIEFLVNAMISNSML